MKMCIRDRGKSEFVIRKMAGWAVDQFLEENCDNRILMRLVLDVYKRQLLRWFVPLSTSLRTANDVLPLKIA